MSNGSRPLLSPRAIRLGIYVAATLATARPVSAQFASAIDLSSRTTQRDVNGWSSQLAISPFLRYDHPRIEVDAQWTAFRGDSRRADGFGGASATYFSPSHAGLSVSASGFADRALLNETFAVSRIGADTRLSYRAGRNGAWIGREVSRDNRSTPASPVPQFSTGAWHQSGSAIITFSLSSFGTRVGARGASTRIERRASPTPLAPDSEQVITVADSGSAGRRQDWRDAELGLRWAIGRVALQGVVGTRFSATSQPNETWGQAQGALTLGPQIALIASGGVHPSSAAYGVARSRFFELGVRVSPSGLRRRRLPRDVRPTAAAFRIDDAEHGSRTLRIRVPDARSVELSGDFTNWKPVALEAGDADRWETTLPIAPGVHRLVIRVNGDVWTIPPGVPAIQDEFQGTVGVIVVR